MVPLLMVMLMLMLLLLVLLMMTKMLMLMMMMMLLMMVVMLMLMLMLLLMMMMAICLGCRVLEREQIMPEGAPLGIKGPVVSVLSRSRMQGLLIKRGSEYLEE